MPSIARDDFVAFARSSHASTPLLAIPVAVRLIADHLTPVVAYRRLVAHDHREAPSFLLESVEGGERQGRYSILSANPIAEVLARANNIDVNQLDNSMPHAKCLDAVFSSNSPANNTADPFHTLQSIAANFTLLQPPASQLPACFQGGWVGYAAYDSVRYSNLEKLPFTSAPRDDRHLPDLHFGFYSGVVVFDNVDKTVSVIELAFVETKTSDINAASAYDAALARIRARIDLLEKHTEPLHVGAMPRPMPIAPLPSNMTRNEHAQMVAKAKKYIAAGDIFQVVVGQRFERQSPVDPFDVYRALRCVNPSPYMVYLQSRGCILVASSPEILCRVRLCGLAVPANSPSPPVVPTGGRPKPPRIPLPSKRLLLDTHLNNKPISPEFVARNPYPPGEIGPASNLIATYKNLPHYEMPDATYFVSWRVVDGRALNDTDCTVVLDALRHFDGERCRVFAACVMPDHIHWLVKPLCSHRLAQLVESVKQFAARAVNKNHGVTGPLWQQEHFDHIVRDHRWFAEFVEYIVRNPVEAKLVDAPSMYGWTFVHPSVTVEEQHPPTETVGEDEKNWRGPPIYQVTNRPLAGTRRRGKSPEEDARLERELLADAKERAEHIMLVDLGRNDVGIVAQPGSISLPSVMEVERYSHVMHISSTVTGTLRDNLTCWDALRAALPVGTISGAPKLRAMQIIDELEPVRRGPYGGGLGCVGLGGEMDIALTLRTIVAPLALAKNLTPSGATQWTYHLQAAGGIVADSVTEDEYMETVNKAAALARAIEVAEGAFANVQSRD